MGIYLPNMEMPESCSVCFVKDCAARAKNKYVMSSRGQKCPIDFVPPHGRLIDADALNEAMARMVPWAITDPTVNASLDGLSAAYEAIQAAPTVIEAEEGE